MRPQLTSPAPQSRLATFDPDDLRGLPAAARRWLCHAVAPGTTVPAGIELRLHGEIRIGRWRRFTADQALVPGSGFAWWGRTRIGPVPVSGFDRIADGRGEQRWRALGVLPILRADGFDITASAADRLAAESVLVPSSLVDAIWFPSHDATSATFLAASGLGRRHPAVTVRIGPEGRLVALSLQRWGNPNGGPFGLHRFEVHFDAEFDIGGFRIGDRMHAAWVDGTGHRREFYRAEIDRAQLLKPAVGR